MDSIKPNNNYDSSLPLALNAKQVCAKLNLSKTQLYRIIHSGQLKPLNHLAKRNRLFSYQSVLALLEHK